MAQKSTVEEQLDLKLRIKMDEIAGKPGPLFEYVDTPSESIRGSKYRKNTKSQSKAKNKEVLSNTLQMYMNRVAKYDVLTREEEIMLAKEMKNGAEWAKEKLINHNLRLVISEAKKYMKRERHLDFQDLIQEGNTGLIEALKRYDYRMGNKISTYATWWIKLYITRYISCKARNIRVPVNTTEIINKYYYAINTLSNRLGQEPTMEQVANFIDIDLGKLEEALKLYSYTDTLTIDTPYKVEKEYAVVGEFIEDKSKSPFECTASKLTSEMLEEILYDLNQREEFVLRLRYGLDDGKIHTLESIGKILGVTRERVRQIEDNAIAQIRRHRAIHSLFSMYSTGG